MIAAVVLWGLMGFTGQRSGAYYTAIQKDVEARRLSDAEVVTRLRGSTGATMHWLTVGMFLLIFLDMIFKPGA